MGVREMGQSGRDWLGRVMEGPEARSGGGILIQR